MRIIVKKALYYFILFNSLLLPEILPQQITVISPNGGESWQAGTTQQIIWIDNFSDNVKIDLYKGGAFHSFITASTASDGAYIWSIPYDLQGGSDYKVKITSVIDTTIEDYSDNNFTIVANQVTITSPDGGELWDSGTTQSITWSSGGVVTNVNLYYTSNDSTNWSTISTNEPANTGSYNWTIPSVNSSECKVKIEDVSNSSINDESDNTFTIWEVITETRTASVGNVNLNFGSTNIDISASVSIEGQITVNYYPSTAPADGTKPTGVVVVSQYYWEISYSGLTFSSGKISVPTSTFEGVTDDSKLVWLKRTNSGDAWVNIGGTIASANLESTVSFSSFSEFAIGSTDLVNPLPVELTSFTASTNNSNVELQWKTETEVNNYGFEIERSLKVEDKLWEKIGFVEGHGNSNSPKQYSFTDKNLIGGSRFSYRLKQLDNNGKFAYSDEVEVVLIPTIFELAQNYPNPFNPVTTISYSLPVKAQVELVVYNTLGESIVKLVNEEKEAGRYEVKLNATNLPSGIYFYKLQSNSFVETKKMVLMK